MAIHQYIGARYVPKFYQNSLDPSSCEWEPNVTYEPLTMVTTPNNHAYISKMTVPDTIGTPAANANYWLETGNFNAYIQALQDELDALEASFDFIYVVEDDTSLTDFNAILNAKSGDTLVIMRANVDATGGGTVDSNCKAVYGIGGYFYSTAGSAQNLTFPVHCRFKSEVKLFEKIIPLCAGGILLGEANTMMFGMDGTKNVDVSLEMGMMIASDFQTLRFYKGVYTSGFENSKSGRTFIMDDGCIFDGILHLAVSNDDNIIVKNTKVIGKIVTTLRIGCYNCDGLYIPDGITLLDTDASYNNQTALHGMNVGVHIYYNSTNVHIGDIYTPAVRARADNVYNAALIIDKDASHNPAQNIFVNSVTAGLATVSSINAVVLLDACHHVHINKITCEDCSALSFINISRSTYIRLGEISASIKGTFGVVANNGSFINIDQGLIYDVNATAFLVAAQTGINIITANYLYVNHGAQGLRAIDNSHIVVLQCRNTCTTPTATSDNGVIDVFKSF